MFALALLSLLASGAQAQNGEKRPGQTHWWPKTTEAALEQAGSNQAEMRLALQQVPKSERDGMRFLIENMPAADLQTLSSKYLLDNTAVAYEAYAKAPWKDSISKDLFLNDILPYSCLNEKRDDSRAMLRERSLPLITDCRTPGEAAQRLNQKLFPLLNARYSTERKRPDQSPLETIESGKATCSGLSILLVDACRAVGIPARVAGTPLWANLRGNHTWVEVWDEGWHFTGASEPDPNGLDRGWFTGDAAQAKKDVPEHAIYASSFKKTGLAFPLVWAPNIQWVAAVNVTDRYTPKTPVTSSSSDRVLVKVVDKSGKRIAAKVTLREAGKSDVAFSGMSRDETVDLNDILGFNVPRACPPLTYEAEIEYGGRTLKRKVKASASLKDVNTITLP